MVSVSSELKLKRFVKMSEDEAQRALMKERLTAAECEEELCLSKDENQRKQGLNQEPDPETSQIKEEPAEQRIKEEEEQLPVSVPEFSAVCVKTEESSLLQQTEPKEEETQGEDISAEPHLHSETEGDTEHSSETDTDEDWRAPLNCSDDGGDYNRGQIRARSTAEHNSGLSSKEPRGNTQQCPVCKKKIKGSKNKLQRHIRIHTGEKPYSCSTCNKTFSLKFNLHSHLRTHTGEKPYKCSTCNKTFTNHSNLTSHKITHTGEQPFSCSICNKKFNQKSNLHKHRKRVHTNVISADT